MQNQTDRMDRRQNRSFGAGGHDDLDLDQRDEVRRARARLPLRLWTEGRVGGKLDFHNCSNISDSGIFIETPEPYPLNALVELEFNLPGVHDPIRAQGRVVSALDEDTAGAAIMGNGFRFEHIAAADRALIRAFVEAASMVG